MLVKTEHHSLYDLWTAVDAAAGPDQDNVIGYGKTEDEAIKALHVEMAYGAADAIQRAVGNQNEDEEWEDPSDYRGMGWVDGKGRP